MKILLTAFGPFQNYLKNPSQMVLEEIINQKNFENILIFETVDVSYDAVNSFVESINYEYDLIIHMGVASDNALIRFEIIAQNLAIGKDVRNVELNTLIENSNISQLKTNFPLTLLEKVVEKHHGDIVFSKDAGAYLCNYIYFKSLFKFQNNTPVLFVHIADFIKNKTALNLKLQTNVVSELISGFILNFEEKIKFLD
jgi:pyroglutamyl-peptidase